MLARLDRRIMLTFKTATFHPFRETLVLRVPYPVYLIPVHPQFFIKKRLNLDAFDFVNAIKLIIVTKFLQLGSRV